MRYVSRTALLILCLASAEVSRADDEAERIQLSREIFISSHQGANFDAIMPLIMDGLKPIITRNDPKITKDFDEIAPLFLAEFGKIKDHMIDDAARLHARVFTKNELEEVLAFYRTPTGQKVATMQPKLGPALMAIGQKHGEKAASQVAEKMKAELKKRGHNI